jgi:filamentous hemagglutinin family protein
MVLDKMLKIKLFTTFLTTPFLLLLSGLINAIPLQAQITPPLDSTGRVMTSPDASRILNIQRSNPSVINGLIPVTGGNSNLSLMNPARFMFGQGASLNVPASFPANGIGFARGGVNAIGSNNYQALVGESNSLASPLTQLGNLMNGGKLSVGEGQSVTLLGGKVINTGTIIAPGGDITITTVPGQNMVSISQAGSPLSLEIATSPGNTNGSVPTAAGLSPLDLPQLLTGAGLPGNGDIKLTSRQGDIRTNSPHPPTGSIRLPRPAINAANVSSSTTLADDKTVTQLEKRQNSEFFQYFGNNLSSKPVSAESIQNTLVDIEQKTGNRSAVIYVNLPEESQNESQTGQRSDELKLVVILPGAKAKSVTVSGVERGKLLQTIQDFRAQIATSYRRGNHSYLKSAQQLYQWLIAPIEPQLQEASINTLLFSMENGMRTLPIAAMHDGKQFLVEKYSLGMIPSFGLLDPKYKTLEKANVLAMGASTFETQAPLPAVSTELSVVNQMWQGKVFLNEDFNRFNLVEPRRGNRYQIVHLATHAEFNPGSADNSYIQLWNDKLRLSEMPKLGWKEAEVDLLTLSACSTAIGNKEAEMGFAGLTVASGVKSALASIWSVSDEGTLALMTEFYYQLRSAKVKSEALRQAQLAMIHGKLKIESGQLRGSGMRGSVALPQELSSLTNTNLSHPYYWSGFTMIGSPW